MKEAASISETSSLLPVLLGKKSPNISNEIVSVRHKSLIHDYPMPPSGNKSHPTPCNKNKKESDASKHNSGVP